MLDQRADLQSQLDAVKLYMSEHGITEQAVRASWTEQERQVENSKVEQALSQLALYARTRLQQALDTDAAPAVPPVLVYRQTRGAPPRPARLVGCVVVPETITGKAALQKTAAELQSALGLEQPWSMEDASLQAALAEWREAEILAVQTLVEKTQIMFKARTLLHCPRMPSL